VYASDAQANALVVPGGSAFNTARHVARCGTNVGILGCVGTDGGYGFFMDAGQRYALICSSHKKRLYRYTLGASRARGKKHVELSKRCSQLRSCS